MDKITYAYLETTNYCNLDCSFCNRDEVIGSLENWGKLLDGIKHHPIQEAKLMGMGEPMLHPQFDEVCRMFKEVFPKCKLIVATNCQYNINDKFRECMKYIDMLYFSIDGYKESYERDRSPAKWSKLLKFLEQFKSVDRYDCDVVVNIQGDEPLVNPNHIDEIIEPMINDSNMNITVGITLFSKENSYSDIKVVKDIENNNLYMSRNDIPNYYKNKKNKLMYKLCTIVPFKKELLMDFLVQMEQVNQHLLTFLEGLF